MEQPTPTEARDLLSNVPRPEDVPTTRVVGITWMVWGLAFGITILATSLLLPPEGTTVHVSSFFAWFGVAAVVPVTMATWLTTKIWDASNAMPQGRAGLWLACAAMAAIIIGYPVSMGIAMAFWLLTNLLGALVGFEPGFSLRGGMERLIVVGLWAIWFGATRWNAPTGSRHIGVWLGVGLIAASVPIGILVRRSGLPEDIWTVAAAFLVMAAYAWFGARLYARG